MRILVADDNRDAADALAMLLRLDGHEVEVTYDGETAFHIAARFLPRLALLDIGMPGMNGYRLASEIRAQPWGEHTRLVAVSGWGQPSDRERSRQAGFNDHLVKPAEPALITGIVADTERG